MPSERGRQTRRARELAALVGLKLSGDGQFGDKSGGCALTAISGDKDLNAKIAERCG